MELKELKNNEKCGMKTRRKWMSWQESVRVDKGLRKMRRRKKNIDK